MKTIYLITFTLNGKQHSCRGESSYPSKKKYEATNYFEDIIKNNVSDFIKKYKEQFNYDGKASNISFKIVFED